MTAAKSQVIEKIRNMSDDLDELQIIERAYMLTRLEHSRKRCAEEGTVPDSDLDQHFAEMRSTYAEV